MSHKPEAGVEYRASTSPNAALSLQREAGSGQDAAPEGQEAEGCTAAGGG